MVQVLQRQPSFGEKLGQGIGAGLGAGFSQAAQFAQQMAMEKYKQKQQKELFQEIEGQGTSNVAVDPQKFREQFIESLPDIENQLGRDLQPEEVEKLWNGYNQMQQKKQPQEDPFLKAKKAAAAGLHDMSRVYTEEAKTGIKAREAEVARGYEESKPTRTRGRELLEDLPYKESALSNMKAAIESGNLGMFTLDNLAEITGIEGLRSPEGAAFKTDAKEFFLGNLSRVGAKGLNQMMEKVVQEMGPLIGRKTEANLAVTEVLGAEMDVTRKEAELINEIGQAYKEKHGHYPDDLAHRVYKELSPYAKQRQKDALAEIKRIKSIYEPKNKEGILMYDPSGNLRRVPHKDISSAKESGYRKP